MCHRDSFLRVEHKHLVQEVLEGADQTGVVISGGRAANKNPHVSGLHIAQNASYGLLTPQKDHVQDRTYEDEDEQLI